MRVPQILKVVGIWYIPIAIYSHDVVGIGAESLDKFLHNAFLYSAWAVVIHFYRLLMVIVLWKRCLVFADLKSIQYADVCRGPIYLYL